MTSSATFGVCFLAACGLGHAFQAQAPSKGTLEGQVLSAKTGLPLKKATVRLNGVGNGLLQGPLPIAGGPNRMPVNIARETDDQGKFVFTGLDAGKYRVAAERQGYLRQNYGARKFSGGSTPVAVAEGQSVKSIDFKLMPQGVITGKVLDEDGEPVANVQVRAMKYAYRSGKKQWTQVNAGQTSDIGEYRLPDLQPGRYVVGTASRNSGMNPGMQMQAANEPLPDKPEMTYASTYYPSTPDATTAAPIDVTEGGEVRGIDIRLVKTSVFRVRGKVTGMPAPGPGGGRGMVQVMFSKRDGPPGQVGVTQARAPEGQFEIRNLPPGQYLAHAQTQGGALQSVGVAPFDIVGNHVDGLVVAMSSGGDVQGSVKVADATTPVEMKNLQVSLRLVGFGGNAPRARVAEDMKFTLKGVPPVAYAVSVNGFPNTMYLKSIQYGGRDVTDEGIEMTNGGTLEVVLSAGAGVVDVVVQTRDGKAANGAQVVLIPKDGVPTSSSSADENGMLSIKGLKPGDYKLLAWEDVEPGAPFDPDYLRKFERRMKSVKLDASGHEAVQLKAIAPDEN